MSLISLPADRLRTPDDAKNTQGEVHCLIVLEGLSLYIFNLLFSRHSDSAARSYCSLLEEDARKTVLMVLPN